jgi:hypothetical protein
MSRMLIGSSNVYRNYKPEKFINFKEYKMVKCVEMESFDAHMTSLEPSVTEVVISVLENFLDRAVKSTDKREMAEEISSAVNKYFEIVERVAMENPGSKFVLVDPIMRPKLVWYDPALDMIKDTHREGTSKIGISNVSRVDVIARLSQEFEKDGVHLTPTSGKTFVMGIMEEAEKVFAAQLVDLSDDEETHDKKRKTRGGA